MLILECDTTTFYKSQNGRETKRTRNGSITNSTLIFDTSIFINSLHNIVFYHAQLTITSSHHVIFTVAIFFVRVMAFCFQNIVSLSCKAFFALIIAADTRQHHFVGSFPCPGVPGEVGVVWRKQESASRGVVSDVSRLPALAGGMHV